MPDTTLMNGLEFVTGLSQGTVPRPPMADLLPFTLLPPEDGHVELLAKPEARFLNMMNTVHGGWMMTMLDTSMSLAARTTLMSGEVCPSQETSVKFIRPISADCGELRITGNVISLGRTVITLEGRIESPQGKLYAHGTSTCLIVRPGP
ncbi:PaaI family thioesterase [Rhizobium sp. LEGMi135b]